MALMIVYHWVRARQPYVLYDSAKQLQSSSLTLKGDKFIGTNAVIAYGIISKSCTWR